MTGDNAAETIKEMINISNNDEADNKIEDNRFISISQIEARISTPISRKRPRIAYMSSSNDEKTAIDINVDKDTN